MWTRSSVPLVLAALAALAWAIIGVSFASLAPPEMVPQVFSSSHIRHFAAFYIIALTAAAALPGMSLKKIGGGMVVFALVLELLRMVVPTGRVSRFDDLISDFAGICLGLLPILVGKLRDAYVARQAQASTGEQA